MEGAAELKGTDNAPVLPWMRNPIDVSLSDSCPLSLLPFLDSRYQLFPHNRILVILNASSCSSLFFLFRYIFCIKILSLLRFCYVLFPHLIFSLIFLHGFGL